MEKLEIFYKAFEEYKRLTALDVETKKFQKFYSSSSGKKYEDVTIVYSTCTIEEDWVNALEKGIVFLEKAVREERQFIRNDEEVLPIEKIRKTTVDGIRDLAKHSNYITHEPSDKNDSVVMPDKMLMVQRESDYAVYENRVVYATLIYLKDFVSSRLNKIKEATSKYDANAYIKKRIDTGNRKLEVDINLKEIRLDDPYCSTKNACADIVKRLDNVMSNIMALLKTPLMTEVSRHDLVTRPITKTNVLRMNINFRESLALFDYIAEYNRPGYTIQTIEKSFSPFTNDMINSYSNVVMLSSFLTYMYSNNLTNELKEQYIRMEEELKKEEEKKLIDKLRSFSLKAGKEGQSLEQLLEEFEKGYRILEKRNYELENTIATMEDKHKEQLQAVKDECDNKIESIYEETEKQKNDLINEYEQKLRTQAEENALRTNELHESYRNEINAIQERARNDKESFIAEKTAEINAMKDDNLNLSKENEKISEENQAARALVISLKSQLGRDISTDDFLGREDFDNLEKDKEFFDRFFNDAWKAARKHIRKTILKSEKELKAEAKKAKEESQTAKVEETIEATPEVTEITEVQPVVENTDSETLTEEKKEEEN